ncbi:MAG: peptidase E [Cyclobacteriaceae bacterium]|nr:peptidase E [Cyclobacteriaceae bacterium]
MKQDVKRKIFITGGGGFKSFSKFIMGLTKKENPKVCYVPTATGDSVNTISNWYASCEDLPVKPFVLKTFIGSYDTKKTFEETIMGMDIIFVGGGNTLNMIAIWKAQGIDLALRKAYESGIVMSGGSAGSLCWFQSGTTDSRPIKLSKVDCLGWIKGSHCPHYDAEVQRRPLYQDLIKKGELPPGYACDNNAGIYFENEQFVKSVALNKESKSYYVDVVEGQVSEKALPTELL